VLSGEEFRLIKVGSLRPSEAHGNFVAKHPGR
jgi:hypothetical protein